LAHSSSTACGGVEAGVLEAGQLRDGIDAGQVRITNSMSLTGRV
jgi:hypothetical protein